MANGTILVIDDDPKVRALLSRTLEIDGFKVVEAADRASALRALTQHTPDLVTLDLNLGGEDGLDLAREIRRDLTVPIIMITGKGDVIDRIVGLELGADDYIAKPFHVREVLARVRALLRRSAKPQAPTQAGVTLMLDGLHLDLDRMVVRGRDGADCELTTADIKLLRAFVDNPVRALSRDRLMDLANGTDWTPTDRTIDNQVARLRKKIERDPTHPDLIRTVRGVGYMLTQRAEPSKRHA
ncbi:response regulator [Jannaschia donghaensis]|uniref:Transcriptional regulatory protein OmpR n=1 Tax=Jannaschia donghaensis TaxID=420998 RepID=A0A0M6YJ12_9RHOB|nr:response regulator [Jannaschia donghaensis]CTQ50352.1 Transcriptional regulatory protein OmpR [Jannaschia donghaensis]